MKKINYILAAAVVVAFQACDLDLNPHTSYNENNVNVKNDSESQYSTRTDMLGLRNSLYNSWVKDIQEKGSWLLASIATIAPVDGLPQYALSLLVSVEMSQSM